MKALVFSIRLNSLYSIRIPFTWQSALTYPILPPSAVIGILANALQRYKNNRHPLEYLDQVESDVFWAGSRLLTPCIIKSYVISTIANIEKLEDILGRKPTNALGRQFAYSRLLQVAIIFKNGDLIDDIIKSLKTTPLTCGDSESPISLEEYELAPRDVIKNDRKTIETEYPVPFKKDTKIIEGNGQVFLMHERCKRKGKDFPLISYMIPIREEQKILNPSSLTIKVTDEKVLEIEETGNVILNES